MSLNVPASVRAALDDPNGQAPCPPLDDVLDAVDAEGPGILERLTPYLTGIALDALERLRASVEQGQALATLNGTPTGEEIRRTRALAHVAAPVDLTLPKRRGIGRTACGEDMASGETLIAMSAEAISCPTCAAAYVADPSLLGPVEVQR